MTKRIFYAVVLLVVAPVRAQADDSAFGLGNGGDGVYMDSGAINPTITTLHDDVSTPNATSIVVWDATGIATNDILLLWQPAGFTPGSNQTPSVDINGANTGLWQLVKVTSVAGTTIGVKINRAGASLQTPFLADITQVVRVPQYLSFTLTGTVNAPAWNGSTGGIIAFLSQGAINITGNLSADGEGFRGGSPADTNTGGQSNNTNYLGIGGDCSTGDMTLTAGQGQQRGEGIAGRTFNSTDRGSFNVANGGGAGNCIQNGGGGGANASGSGAGAGHGGHGGGAPADQNPGNRGAYILYTNVSMTSQMVMGGGGGAGNQTHSQATAGRSGGGVIWFRGLSLSGTGTLSAKGGNSPSTNGTDDGQGGGGAGGSIYIRVEGAAGLCVSGSISADGSNGLDAPNILPSPGPVGAGGGGSGGRIFIQDDGSGNCTLSTNITVKGGNKGAHPSGATDGDDGSQETAPISQYCSTDGSNLSCPTNGPTCNGCPLAKPACDTTDNHCVECLATDNLCPASKPVCDTSGAEPNCKSCNDDGDCTRFGSSAGNTRFCVGGQCVQCKSTDNTLCPDDHPVCSSGHTCDLCTASTATACADHDLKVCDASPGGSGACVQCVTGADCSATTPKCSSHSCTICGASSDCSFHASDPSPKPICGGGGACRGCAAPSSECHDLLATTPICQSDGSCAACSPTGATGDAQCETKYDPAFPICQLDGSCAHCGGNGDCSYDDARPACITLSGCFGCDTLGTPDDGCSSGHGSTTIHCETTLGGLVGHCVQCRSDNNSVDCTTNADPVCNGSDQCDVCSAPTAAVCQNGQHTGFPLCDTIGDGNNGGCVQCLGNLDCPLNQPVCTDDACGKCASDNDCVGRGANHVCDTSSGACVGCEGNDACTRDLPHCSGSVGVPGSCGDCIDDSDCTLYSPSPSPAPACQHADGITQSPGQCKQCSRSNTTACTGSTPACNFQTGSCQLCTVDFDDLGSNSVGCASNTVGHACLGTGITVHCGCNSDSDCGSATSGRICNTQTHACGDGCSRAPGRNDCPSSQFCTASDTTGAITGVCTMTCNFDQDCTSMTGMPFCISSSTGLGPTDGGNMGVSADGGMGRCAGCRNDGDCSGMTPVCEPTNKVCVQCISTNTAACMASGTGAACLTDDTCGCTQDSDCGASDSGRICDDSSHHCTDGCRVTGGNGCPSGLVCNGTGLVPGLCVVPNDMSMRVDASAPEDLSATPPDLANGNNFRLTGGGFGCDMSGSSSTSLSALFLFALSLVLVRLRRKSSK